MNRRHGLATALGFTLGLAAGAASGIPGGPATISAAPTTGTTGPSTATAPYLVPVAGLEDRVRFTSVLTVGDSVGGYRMVGIPDGLGAYKGPGENATVLMNHEIRSTSGIERAHGSTGAFVARWTINRHTLAVESGNDMVQSPAQVWLWDIASKAYDAATTAWERLCSGDLPDISAFFYDDSMGTRDRIYLNGEETDEGRAFAWVATGPYAGEARQLPRLGRFAFENVVASPHRQQKTVVIPLDDADLSTSASTAFPSELAVYVGAKQGSGHPIERAGLTNGKLHGVKVTVGGNTVTEESNAFGLGTVAYAGSGRFSLVELGDGGDVSAQSASEMRDEFIAKDILRMQRIEDGAWDPRRGKGNDFYFVTTGSFSANASRLWRLRFDDIEQPELGGSIDILINGGEIRMLDNIGMDALGRLILQEDPGSQDHLAKTWLYNVDTGALIKIAEFDPDLFDPTKPDFITRDEEGSGVIDAAAILGKGYFLLDAQVHKNLPDPELVQMGQLLAMWVDPTLGVAP